MACASAPVGPNCTMLPTATIPVSPTTVAQFEVQVSTATAVSTSASTGWTKWPRGSWSALLGGTGIFFLWLAWRFDSRGARMARTVVVLTVLALGFSACGGGSSDPTATADPPLGVGAYNLTVTASDGTESLPINLTLNVTQ